MKKQKEYLAELYVELTTRKLALDFNEETDCIYEVYNSWFKFFGWCREQMKKIAKECPQLLVHYANRSKHETVTAVNTIAYSYYSNAMEIIRPHIEKYSYDFRVWWETYNHEEKFPASLPPKSFQTGRLNYFEIVTDIKAINKKYQDMVQEIIKELVSF